MENQIPYLAKQKPIVIWLTGLSGAGKTTIAESLKSKFSAKNIFSVIIDGDALRNTINKNLGYTESDRQENVRRAAEIANIFVENNIVTICTFMSPTIAIRQLAKEIIGEDKFYEVFVKASIENCVDRDVKGLYARYKSGELQNMSGIDALYQEPENPFLVIDTNKLSIEESVNLLLGKVEPRILELSFTK